jgi:predicted ATP-dependent protease
MTGEISLRGLVLPVGGIKEKVLGAQQAGITTVLLPDRNKPDLEDVPQSARDKITFKWMKRVEDAISFALEPLVPVEKKGGPGKEGKNGKAATPPAARATKPKRKRADQVEAAPVEDETPTDDAAA